MIRWSDVAWLVTLTFAVGCAAGKSPDTATANAASVAIAPPEPPAPRAITDEAASSAPPPPLGALAVDLLRPKLKRCYESGLARDRTMAGTVFMVTRVGPDGSVTKTEPQKVVGLDLAVVRCLEGVINGATFEAKPRGSVINIPLRFQLPTDAGAPIGL